MGNINSKLFILIHNLSGKNRIIDYLMIFGAEAIIYLTGFFLFFFSIQIFKLSVLAIFLSLIAILIIHLVIKEKRPFVKFHFIPLISFYKNLSFPSIHSTIMSIFLFSCLYYNFEWSLLIFGLLLYVAFSRIYTGLHYPIDILGGILTGFLSVTFLKLFI